MSRTTSPTRRYHRISGNVEDIEEYKPDRFHPVELGDILNKQYKVLHKLGHGGHSTVWLTRDKINHRYVSVKINMAYLSEAARMAEKRLVDLKKNYNLTCDFIGFSEGHFLIDGPNGRHLAIYSEVMGPSLFEMVIATECGTVEAKYALSVANTRRLALQITQAVAYIHDSGLAHGDLTCNNVLLELRSLDNLSSEEIVALLGPPHKTTIARRDGKPIGSRAPRYVLEHANMKALLPYWTGNIKIIDFGTCYPVDEPPSWMGIPYRSRSPEHLILNQVGKGSDIWALAVLIYWLRSGNCLFFRDLKDDESDILHEIEKALGPIPYNKNSSAASRERSRNRPIFKNLINEIKIGRSREKISKGEAQHFFDFLSRALDYNVKRRSTADEMLKHPWLSRMF